MGSTLHIKCTWRTWFTCWINIMGNNISSNKKKNVWTLLLHSPSLHSIHGFLPTPHWNVLCLHYASWFLPLLDRSILEILAIQTKSSSDFSPSFDLWNCWTQLLQNIRLASQPTIPSFVFKVTYLTFYGWLLVLICRFGVLSDKRYVPECAKHI